MMAAISKLQQSFYHPSCSAPDKNGCAVSRNPYKVILVAVASICFFVMLYLIKKSFSWSSRFIKPLGQDENSGARETAQIKGKNQNISIVPFDPFVSESRNKKISNKDFCKIISDNFKLDIPAGIIDVIFYYQRGFFSSLFHTFTESSCIKLVKAFNADNKNSDSKTSSNILFFYVTKGSTGDEVKIFSDDKQNKLLKKYDGGNNIWDMLATEDKLFILSQYGIDSWEISKRGELKEDKSILFSEKIPDTKYGRGEIIKVKNKALFVLQLTNSIGIFNGDKYIELTESPDWFLSEVVKVRDNEIAILYDGDGFEEKIAVYDSAKDELISADYSGHVDGIIGYNKEENMVTWCDEKYITIFSLSELDEDNKCTTIEKKIKIKSDSNFVRIKEDEFMYSKGSNIYKYNINNKSAKLFYENPHFKIKKMILLEGTSRILLFPDSGTYAAVLNCTGTSFECKGVEMMPKFGSQRKGEKIACASNRKGNKLIFVGDKKEVKVWKGCSNFR